MSKFEDDAMELIETIAENSHYNVMRRICVVVENTRRRAKIF